MSYTKWLILFNLISWSTSSVESQTVSSQDEIDVETPLKDLQKQYKPEDLLDKK